MTRLWRRFFSGLRAFFQRGRADRDLDEEIGAFVQMATERNRSAGMGLDEASRAARLQVGSVASVKEQVRNVGWESIADSLFQDVRFGVRMLLRRPAFALVAVLALALGIGVNTAVFTAYKAMVARPLDARDPGTLVNMALTRPTGTATFQFSYPDYEAYRDSVPAFAGLIAFSNERLTLSNAGESVSQRAAAAVSSLGRLGLLGAGTGNAEFASTFAVSDNYLQVLGVPVFRGRGFESFAASERAASPPVLISENYWQKRFGGDESILGRTIHLNGIAVTIVGITPHDFIGTGVSVPDFWMPLSLEPLVHGNDRWLTDRENEKCRLFARLTPGTGVGQAQTQVAAIADRLRALHDPRVEAARPASALVWPGSPFPLPLKMYAGLTPTILLIMAAAAMVLVVACANVGSLQLARARSRQPELLTRRALGAGRGRLIRQLLTESAVVSLVSGVMALLVTWALLRVSVKLVSESVPPEFGTLVFNVTPDPGIFAYVLAISVIAGVLFGLAPALEGSRSALASSVRSSTTSARSRRIQDALVVAQVSFSLVLLIAGSLLIRSAGRSLDSNPGYDSTRIVDLEFQFPEGARYTDARKNAVALQLRARLMGLPGVTAITSARPPDDNRFRTGAAPVDRQASFTGGSVPHYSYIQAGHFKMLGIPVLLGRDFQSGAGETGRAVILSESAARQLWPGEAAVGRSVRLGDVNEQIQLVGAPEAGGLIYEVIGVVRDTRGVQFDGSDARHAYLPLPDDRVKANPILIRTETDPAELMRAIDGLTASIDPELLTTTSTLDDRLRRSGPFVVSSLCAAVAVGVGLVGLFLALMGIHGTVSYVVMLRTREVGIRMAVGAQPRDIIRLILGESTRPVLIGLLAGMVLAVGASYLLRGLLFGISAIDGVSFAGVSLSFLAVALFAAYRPSRRALAVDPVVALRDE
jgi:predicted permease